LWVECPQSEAISVDGSAIRIIVEKPACITNCLRNVRTLS
jgi:hypothetical protein